MLQYAYICTQATYPNPTVGVVVKKFIIRYQGTLKSVFVIMFLQEMDLIREQVQRLVSLPIWSCLLPVSTFSTIIYSEEKV